MFNVPWYSKYDLEILMLLHIDSGFRVYLEKCVNTWNTEVWERDFISGLKFKIWLTYLSITAHGFEFKGLFHKNMWKLGIQKFEKGLYNVLMRPDIQNMTYKFQCYCTQTLVLGFI